MDGTTESLTCAVDASAAVGVLGPDADAVDVLGDLDRAETEDLLRVGTRLVAHVQLLAELVTLLGLRLAARRCNTSSYAVTSRLSYSKHRQSDLHRHHLLLPGLCILHIIIN